MTKSRFTQHVLPFLVATGGEFAALYYWLVFNDRQLIFWAIVVLWTGFLVERLAVAAWMHYVYEPAAPVGRVFNVPAWLGLLVLLGVTLTEIIIWGVWLWLADGVSIWLALGLFLIFMQIQHAVEMAMLKRQPLFSYVGNGRTLFYTLMEVIGAGAWLALTRAGHPVAGALSLLGGLTVEHVIQGSALRPNPPGNLPSSPTN